MKLSIFDILFYRQPPEIRGYESAKECIKNHDGDKLEYTQKMLNQARSDLEPTAFTKGWKNYCKEYLQEHSKETHAQSSN